MLFVVCAKEAGTAEVGRVLQGGGWRAKSSVGGISTNPPPPHTPLLDPGLIL